MKVAKIFYGLRQKAARKFRWLGKVRAAWCSAADRRLPDFCESEEKLP